ncbi:MAG: HipA domain-containing protein [Eubacteriales bacterium]|nr:HipA domain-containing protein [Eubacteriales bacterium]
MMEEKTIYVYENWSEAEPILIGMLYVSYIRGREQFSFEYETNWLTSEQANYCLDPDLILYNGRHYVPMDKRLFGVFADSCPDRWGRLLMRRREAEFARRAGRKPKKLGESDYLLGVYDKARMGALRFKTEKDGGFLSDNQELATPPWTTLRTLEAASWGFENDESGIETKWLKQLLAPGSSLGGARPKATVKDEKGNLWIAKFPSKQDECNSGAWEMVVHDLAQLCGLDVPEAKLETFSKNGSTFLVKRFDRDKDRRIHFASAMTLLGKTDGASGEDGSSYLEMASFIKANGAEPKKDLEELWKRIVFNMAVSNTDDHLRNHGFILTQKGWRLSPLYDVNPVPYGDALSLNVSMDDNSISVELAKEVAKYFGIDAGEAERASKEIISIAGEKWMSCAEKYGLSRSACEYMRPAFEI